MLNDCSSLDQHEYQNLYMYSNSTSTINTVSSTSRVIVYIQYSVCIFTTGLPKEGNARTDALHAALALLPDVKRFALSALLEFIVQVASFHAITDVLV